MKLTAKKLMTTAVLVLAMVNGAFAKDFVFKNATKNDMVVFVNDNMTKIEPKAEYTFVDIDEDADIKVGFNAAVWEGGFTIEGGVWSGFEAHNNKMYTFTFNGKTPGRRMQNMTKKQMNIAKELKN